MDAERKADNHFSLQYSSKGTYEVRNACQLCKPRTTDRCKSADWVNRSLCKTTTITMTTTTTTIICWWRERFCASVPRLIRMSFSTHAHTHTRSPIQIWPALWMSECNMFVYDDVPIISLDRQSVLLTSETRPLCVLPCVCVCNIECVIVVLEFCHTHRLTHVSFFDV